jgi:hypothetical protein
MELELAGELDAAEREIACGWLVAEAATGCARAALAAHSSNESDTNAVILVITPQEA